jgi:hypothetical protein
VTRNPDNLGRVDVGATRRNVALSMIALAIAATTAIVGSVTDANAGAREVNASSYGFADSLLPNKGLEPPQKLSLSGRDWALQCTVNCGPAFGTSVMSRSELLTSNNADVATRKTTDSAGHTMGVGGTVMVERLEPDASGSLLTNWVVVSERTVDENGSHSWSCCPACRLTRLGCRMTSTGSKALRFPPTFWRRQHPRPKRRPG